MGDKEEEGGGGGGGGLVWFLAGLGLGLAVAVLYAPRPGRDVRRYVSSKAGEAHDLVTRRGRQVYDRGREVLDEASEMVERASRVVSGPE